MRGKRLLLCFLTMVFLNGPVWALAYSGSDSAFSLGEVVVTGEMPGVKDVAISHEITEEEIEATGSKTLAEALRYAPGVVVTYGSKNEPQITIHGFKTDKSLFLLDGIPYYETYYGKLNLDQIPAEIISKIEITKNAPSVLYGPNVQAAVINVVTKKGTEEPSIGVIGEAGQNRTYRLALSHGNQIGNVNYWFSYSRRQTDGWRMSSDYKPEEAEPRRPFMGDPMVTEDGGYRNNADLLQDSLWARIGLTPNEDAEYFLSLHMIQAERGMPFNTDEYRIFETRGDDAGFSNLARFENYDDWGLDLSGRQQVLPWLTLRGKLFYHEHQDDYVSYADVDLEEKIARSTYEDKYVGGSLFTDLELVPWHKGSMALHYKRDVHEDRSGSNLPFEKYVSYTGSLGMEHEFFSKMGLTAVIGASYDWLEVTSAEENTFDDDYNFAGQVDLDKADPDSEFNPMAGLNWELSGATRVYGSVARKTRFPTLRQLYSSTSGNPDLDSEKSINYTLGVQHSFANLVHMRLEGFFHDISDWISRDYYGAEDIYIDEIYVNVEEVEMRGFEAGIKYTPLKDFSLSLDYTYNDAKNKSDKAVTKKVVGVPKHHFVAGASARVPWIDSRLDLRGIFVDSIYSSLPTAGRPDTESKSTASHFTLDARLAKDLGERFSAYIEAKNLLDKNYESEVGFPGPGRNVLVGVKAKF